MEVEFGTTAMCAPMQGATLAATSERLGFDVQLFGDNPFRTGEPFGEMRDAAAATTRIRLMIGVTNFVTRHPAVVAAGIATVQQASDGRAICGVGKGDSAVGMVGLRPQRHDDFARDVGRARVLLGGGAVRFGDVESRIEWLPAGGSGVPLEVAASGPRSIALAATVADRLTLAVGADEGRLRWALDVVDRALAAAGRPRASLRVGAAVSIALDDDREAAVETLRHRIAGWLHMASFPGHDLSSQPEVLRRATTHLRTGYDYAFHRPGAMRTGPYGEVVDAALADWYGIGGPPAHVVERLVGLAGLGLRHFHVSLLGEEREWMAEAVMPAVRDRLSELRGAPDR